MPTRQEDKKVYYKNCNYFNYNYEKSLRKLIISALDVCLVLPAGVVFLASCPRVQGT